MFKLDRVTETFSHPNQYDSLFIKVEQPPGQTNFLIVKAEGKILAKINFNRTGDLDKDFVLIINSVISYKVKNNYLRMRIFVEGYDQLSLRFEDEMKQRIQRLDNQSIEFFDLSKMGEIIKDFVEVKKVLENGK